MGNTFFIHNNKMDGHDIEIHSLEELFEALKIVRDEWKEDHAHLEMLKTNGLTNHTVAEVTIPVTEDKHCPFVIL